MSSKPFRKPGPFASRLGVRASACLVGLCLVAQVTSCGNADEDADESSIDVLAGDPSASSTMPTVATPGVTSPASNGGSQPPAPISSPPSMPPSPPDALPPDGPSEGMPPQPTVTVPSPTATSPVAPPPAPTSTETPDGGGGSGGDADTPAAGGGMGGAESEPETEPEPGGASTSMGCGNPTSLTSGDATIDVSGTQREYILKLPDDYDPDRPYKLVFGLHWRGGQASDVSGGTIGLGDYYGLEELADGSAIFVSPNGLDNGWANSGGRDIEFMRALVALFESELCIDLDRIFSVGFSFGGMMSFAIACEMGDVFRAIAPIAGALYSGCGDGTEPIALWGAHGIGDDVVPIGDGRSGVQEMLDRNNCGDQTTAVEPSPCVTYEGCDEGYPVTWCEFDGGHSPSGWMSEPIWEFFSQF